MLALPSRAHTVKKPNTSRQSVQVRCQLYLLPNGAAKDAHAAGAWVGLVADTDFNGVTARIEGALEV